MLELPIVIHYDDIFESSENIPETNKLGYDLSGTMDVGPFTLPYQAKGSLNLPKIPKLSLKTIRVSEISQTYASVIFEMDIDNGNPFGQSLHKGTESAEFLSLIALSIHSQHFLLQYGDA